MEYMTIVKARPDYEQNTKVVMSLLPTGASKVQRALGLGYNAAMRLLETIENDGLIRRDAVAPFQFVKAK